MSVQPWHLRIRAFTLIELLAVLLIIGLLLAATFVPYALSLRETVPIEFAARANLNRIWSADALNHYGTIYPRTRFDPTAGNRWTAFTGADSPDPFAASSDVQSNDVSASMWLLIRAEFAKPSDFVCPSSDGTPDPLLDAAGRPTQAKQRGNFRSSANLTYSIASPFSAVPEYALTDTLPSNFVLVADQAPSAASLSRGAIPPFDAPATTLAAINSVNHRRGGQNVLYASGTVEFESSPYCGVGRTRVKLPNDRWVDKLDGDNIYTALAPSPLINTSPSHESPGFAGTNVGPAWSHDTYLVPGAQFEAPTVARAKPPLTAAAGNAPTSAPATTKVASTRPAATTAASAASTTQSK